MGYKISNDKIDVERPGFRNFTITNIKITKYEFFIYEFIFSCFEVKL